MDPRAELTETWDLWFPQAGAAGLSFARTKVAAADAGDRVLVHAAPPVLQVLVRDQEERLIAKGEGLERGEPGPMTFLVRRRDRIELQDGWPTDADLGRLVILPGGETGVLKSWWHAEDRSEWRWQVEFYNHL